MATQVSQHFTLEELTFSETAVRNNIDNSVPQELYPNIQALAAFLEDVRAFLKFPIHINSAYRSLRVNTLLGSRPTSEHCRALAADFVCPSFGSPDRIVQAIMGSNFNYNQLIREYDSWVHISIPENGKTPKKQVLIIDAKGTRPYA